jgi:putative heme iron utilization protein
MRANCGEGEYRIPLPPANRDPILARDGRAVAYWQPVAAGKGHPAIRLCRQERTARGTAVGQIVKRVNEMVNEEPPFLPMAAARRVLRLAATGALATSDAAGAPFASLVTTATTAPGEPILLLSRLAVHTRNLDRDRRASLLLVAPGGEGGDPLAGARLSISGEVVGDDDPAIRRRFLARHEEAAAYADFADFAFYRLAVRQAHLVAGFGRIVTVEAAKLLVDSGDSAALIDAEESAVAHMNADHAEALALYATRLCGMADGAWIATGIDPDGLDLRAGATRARLDFPQKVRTGGELRATLVKLAEEARGRGRE